MYVEYNGMKNFESRENGSITKMLVIRGQHSASICLTWKSFLVSPKGCPWPVAIKKTNPHIRDIPRQENEESSSEMIPILDLDVVDVRIA